MPQNEYDIKNYGYTLPERLIAQTPLENRDGSRLLVADRKTGAVEHRKFSDIKEYLKSGDVLVINNSKVLPARLFGYKENKKDSLVEFLLVENIKGDEWEVMVKPGKKAKVGDEFYYGDGILKSEVKDILADGNRIIKFTYGGNFYEILDNIGIMPLPPYIKIKLQDKNRYQTVYADKAGSVAAPTAGLHFTEQLLNEINGMGVKIAPILLHVGLGTFKPVKANDIREHVMHSEYYSISEESAEIINDAKKNGGRVIAVGTTSCRTLESAADKDGFVKSGGGKTDIFIYGDYKFKSVDSLITNFHLPESTLLMLISAFYDREKILDLYKTAVEEEYRFFSFGDAMFLI